MPELNEETKENILTTAGKIPKEIPNISEDDIVIHTIPKKFQTATLPNSKAKSIGLLILVSGGAVLILGGAFLYFYVFNSTLPYMGKQIQVESDSGENSSGKSETINSEATTGNKAGDINQNEAKKAEININETATSTGRMGDEIPAEAATSAAEDLTEEQATTTFKIDNEPIGSSTAVSLITPVDTDNDGLYDIEEILLGSDIDKRDSDRDTYEDLVEILKLYNPTGNGSIIVNANIKKYVNNRYGYYLYYPSIWAVGNVGGEDSVVFNTGNNQFIQVIVQPNPKNITLNQWYLTNTKISIIDNNQILYKPGWEAIKSTDGPIDYLTKPNLNFIIIMTYSLGTGNILNYKNIFDMMVNSLETNN